jgi:alkanesulfonate monooxygenase SsuD/methylene tetrahydromethanopterin reductase-like flavin-dependent oxidoreductase (luciferase family)
MKIGVGLPFKTPTESWPYIKDVARMADEGPFHSFGVLDRLAYDNYEPLAMLAAVAAITTRVELVTAIIMPTLRNAGVFAKQAATIDAISNGRLHLGIAVGGREDDSIVAPVDFHTRGKRFEEQLVHMKRIWMGETLPGAQRPVGPRPVQPGGPEILVGGTHPNAIARVGRLADGYVMGGRALEREWAADIVRQVHESWHKAGREGSPRIVVTLPCALGEGADEAVAEAIGDYYGGRATAGAARQARPQPTSADAIRAGIELHEELGTDEIIFRPVTPDLAQVEALAEVISR